MKDIHSNSNDPSKYPFGELGLEPKLENDVRTSRDKE
jgi:hypothetical protein